MPPLPGPTSTSVGLSVQRKPFPRSRVRRAEACKAARHRGRVNGTFIRDAPPPSLPVPTPSSSVTVTVAVSHTKCVVSLQVTYHPPSDLKEPQTLKYYSALKKKKILPYAPTWMTLEGIMLREIHQSQKDKYSVIPLR